MEPNAWERRFQNVTLTNRSQKCSNLSWIFLPVVLTKLRWVYLKFWVSNFYRFFFFRKFQIHHCSLWGNQKLQYVENEKKTPTFSTYRYHIQNLSKFSWIIFSSSQWCWQIRLGVFKFWKSKILKIFSSILCYCTAELCRHAGVSRLSVGP